MNSSIERVQKLCKIIYDKKGMNILALNVKGVTDIADYIIIAEGNVDKHVQGIAFAIQDYMRQQGEEPVAVEGVTDGQWVVIDYFDVMIHLFAPGFRDRYRLEELWRASELVEVDYRDQVASKVI